MKRCSCVISLSGWQQGLCQSQDCIYSPWLSVQFVKCQTGSVCRCVVAAECGDVCNVQSVGICESSVSSGRSLVTCRPFLHCPWLSMSHSDRVQGTPHAITGLSCHGSGSLSLHGLEDNTRSFDKVLPQLPSRRNSHYFNSSTARCSTLLYLQFNFF